MCQVHSEADVSKVLWNRTLKKPAKAIVMQDGPDQHDGRPRVPVSVVLPRYWREPAEKSKAGSVSPILLGKQAEIEAQDEKHCASPAGAPVPDLPPSGGHLMASPLEPAREQVNLAEQHTTEIERDLPASPGATEAYNSSQHEQSATRAKSRGAENGKVSDKCCAEVERQRPVVHIDGRQDIVELPDVEKLRERAPHRGKLLGDAVMAFQLQRQVLLKAPEA